MEDTNLEEFLNEVESSSSDSPEIKIIDENGGEVSLPCELFLKIFDESGLGAFCY